MIGKKITKMNQNAKKHNKYEIYGLHHSNLTCWRPCENTLLLFIVFI